MEPVKSTPTWEESKKRGEGSSLSLRLLTCPRKALPFPYREVDLAASHHIVQERIFCLHLQMRPG